MFVCKAVAGIGLDVDPNENDAEVGATEAFVAGAVVPPVGGAPNDKSAPEDDDAGSFVFAAVVGKC
jgi:hypothetical protein